MATPAAADAPAGPDLWHPPGRLVQVDGRTQHLHCTGHGRPTVVLEAGLGGFSLEWSKVQADLDDAMRVCSYDRAGYGWSAPAAGPRDADHLADELHALLRAAGEQGPWLLAGHSFGGLVVQRFAQRFPRQVAGLLLLDASSPRQFEVLPRPQREAHRVVPGARRRVVSFTRLPEHYPPGQRMLALRLMHRRSAVRTQRAELSALVDSARQVARGGPLPPVPTVVVSRGIGPGSDPLLEPLWQRLQDELAHSTPWGTRVVARYSGHYVHLDQPWLVEDAVRNVRQRIACQQALVASASHRVIYPAFPGQCQVRSGKEGGKQGGKQGRSD